MRETNRPSTPEGDAAIPERGPPPEFQEHVPMDPGLGLNIGLRSLSIIGTLVCQQDAVGGDHNVLSVAIKVGLANNERRWKRTDIHNFDLLSATLARAFLLNEVLMATLASSFKLGVSLGGFSLLVSPTRFPLLSRERCGSWSRISSGWRP
jgi:hypothetical protein